MSQRKSQRLTNSLREAIVRTVVKKTLDPKIETHRAEVSAKGIELANAIVQQFHEATATLPTDWFPKAKNITVYMETENRWKNKVYASFGDSYTVLVPQNRLESYGEMFCYYQDLNAAQRAMVDELKDLKDTEQQLGNQRYKLQRDTESFLRQFNTTKQLEQAWPDVTNFYPASLLSNAESEYALMVLPDSIKTVIDQYADTSAVDAPEPT